ncbi:MAG: nitrate reductase cytochrome c-type subunit [Rhodocyclaceae bacterium]|nr:nitrate reductase cytochrome c-type subunit [Rhodocyclaceae bacterium]
MRNKSIKLTLASMTASLIVSITLVAGCATTEKMVSARGTDVAAADTGFMAREYTGKKPGLQQPIARTFKEQPPLIPHAMTNFDSVTLEENQCMSCHGPEKYKEKKAPKLGESHFAGKQISMARYECSMCHVPQTDAPPLVGSTFIGNLPSPR